MDIDLVCQRLTAVVKAYGIVGMSCVDYVPDVVEPPMFYPADVVIDYDQTFGGDPDITVMCRVLVSKGDDQAGQRLLRGYMASTGAKSIKAAIESGRGAPGVAALSGACDDLHVRRVQGHRVYTVGEKSYYGAEWVVHIIGDGD
jgi:hypothetical protein